MMRIIVFDDDESFVGQIQESLARMKKSQVEVHADVEKAFKAIVANPQDIFIVLISKELKKKADAGFDLCKKIRANKKTESVPYILISSLMGNIEFARHQKTSEGANAYLKKPLQGRELIQTIEAVMGESFPGMDSSAPRPIPAPPAPAGLNVILEEASKVQTHEERLTGLIDIPMTFFPDENPMKNERSVVTMNPLLTAAANPPPPPVQIESIEPVVSITREEASIPTQPTATQPTATATPAISSPLMGNEVNLSTMGGESFEVQIGGGQVLQQAPQPQNEFIETTEPSFPGQFGTDAENIQIALPSEATKISPKALAAMQKNEQKAEPKTEEVDPQINIEIEEPKLASQLNEIPQEQVREATREAVAAPTENDVEIEKDLPYLFGASGTKVEGLKDFIPKRFEGLKLDAISDEISKITESSGDISTLKKYLMMREQDIAILSSQLSYAKEELRKSDNCIKSLNSQIDELLHRLDQCIQRIDILEKERHHYGKSQQEEVDKMQFDIKTRNDRVKFLEDQLSNVNLAQEKLKERVRQDIRKIRARERELENKLEILKKDSETLIAGREGKILELKRKIDLLEFNYDTLQNQNEKERANVSQAHGKIEKVVKVLKLAMGIIEGEAEKPQHDEDENILKTA